MKTKWLQVVCVSVALAGASALVWADSRLPSTDVAKAQLVEWIRNNNKWGPDHQIVKDMGDQVSSDVNNTNLLELTMGKGLTRAGRTARLCIFAGDFFAFEMTDAQAEAGDNKPMSVGYSTGTKTRDKREVPPIAKLSKLSIKNADNLSGNDKVSGSVSVDVTGQLPAKPALRLTWMADRNTRSLFVYPTVNAGENALNFEFNPLNDKDSKPTKGPVVVYIDLCTINTDGGAINTNLLGNTVATLVNVE